MLVKCENCEAIVDGEVIGSYKYFDDEDGLAGRYSFLKCPICARPFIMLEIDFGPGLDETTQIYPPNEMDLSRVIPDALRSAYDEANVCFRAKAYTATAIMCRKILEGICEENKIQVRNLAHSLKELKDKGIIENRLYEWADALRLLGNEAAHGVNTQISHQDAKDILEFTHALLEYVFTFQEKYKQFMGRRQSQGSEQSTPPY